MDFLNFFFPKNCVLCGTSGKSACLDCLNKLESAKLRCLSCLKKNPLGNYCPKCVRDNKPDVVKALFKYDGKAKELIHLLKFEDFTDLANCLGDRLAQLIEVDSYKDFSLVPIPLDPASLRARGYNQSLLLAKAVSKKLLLPIADCLTKQRTDRRQFEITEKTERLHNIRGAFRLKSNCKIPFKIIIIDDVITSGATVEEATRVLKKAGAKEVVCVSVAMG